jgi:hypothetical protein
MTTITRADMSREEAILLLGIAEAELAQAHATIERREAVIRILEADIESIGAGGVSGKRITDDGTLVALQACERAYHQMMIHGTPQAGQAHDKARVEFWRVFGGTV